jgi:25S rRNA (cytosine2278-C5)-methyltransferase
MLSDRVFFFSSLGVKLLKNTLRVPVQEDTEAVVRCSAVEDATNGFFVSCFVRRAEEIVVTRRKNILEAQPIVSSVKRKVQPEEDDREGASAKLASKRRRKRKK